MRGRTVVVAGGGTGGHVYPALAMAEALAHRGARVVYYGDPRRLEGEVVPRRGIEFRAVPAPQYPRRGGLAARARFALELLRAVLRARRLLGRDRADAVLGVGGYISAPPVLAAWTRGLPVAVHESNVTPGLANRLCARVADRVLLADPATRLPGRAPREVVGFPVDPRVAEGDRAAALARYGLTGERPVLLVVGGSLGAARINELGTALARRAPGRFEMVLVTGRGDHERVRAELDPLPEGVALVDYEHRMADAYAAADLALCRAGSGTLAELAVVGLPAVLVPSPNVTDDHQAANARARAGAGAAVVVPEDEIAADLDAAAERVAALLADRDRLAEMATAARGLARPDAAERVADVVAELLGARNGRR